MRMEQDGVPPEDGRGPEDGQGEGKDWFFDLPNEAGDRAQETQQELRSHVEDNYEESRRRREVFRPIEADLIDEAETRKKKGGGLFGRKKKGEDDRESRGWASPGGMWTLDPTLAKEPVEKPQTEAAPQPNAIRRAFQEPPVEAAQDRSEPAGDNWSTESFEEFTPAKYEMVEAPSEPKRSRWEEMFGTAGETPSEDMGSVEGMKAMWGTSTGKSRRLSEPAAFGGESAHHDGPEPELPAAEETLEVEPAFEAPAEFTARLEEPFVRGQEPEERFTAEPSASYVEAEPDAEFELEAEEATASAATEEAAPRSRWDEMMNRPAGDDTIEAMRRWSAGTRDDEPQGKRRVLPLERDEDEFSSSLEEFARDVELPDEEEPSGGLFGKVGRLFRKKKDEGADLPVEYVAEASGSWLPATEESHQMAEPAAPDGGWLQAVARQALPEAEESEDDLGALEVENDDDFGEESTFHTSRRWQDELLAGREGEREDSAVVPEIRDDAQIARHQARASFMAADLELTSAAPDETEETWEPEEFEPAVAIEAETEVPVAEVVQRDVPQVSEPVDTFYAVEPEAEPTADDGWRPAGEDMRNAPKIEDFYAVLEDSWTPTTKVAEAAPQPSRAAAHEVFEPTKDVEPTPWAPVEAGEEPAPEVGSMVAPNTDFGPNDEPAAAAEWEPPVADVTEPEGTPEEDDSSDAPAGWGAWQSRVTGREADETADPWSSFNSAVSDGDGNEPPKSETTSGGEPEDEPDEDDPWAHFRTTRDDETEPVTASAEEIAPAGDEVSEEDSWTSPVTSWGTGPESEFDADGPPGKAVAEIDSPEEDEDSWGTLPLDEEEPEPGFAPTSSFSEAAGDKAETPVADAPGSFEGVLGMIDEIGSEEEPAGTSALLRTPGASRRPLSERYQDPLLATHVPADPGESGDSSEPDGTDEFGAPTPEDAGGWRVRASGGVPADDQMDLVLRAFEAHAATDEDGDVLPSGMARIQSEHDGEDGIEDLLGDAAEGLDEEHEDEAGSRPFTGLKGFAPQRGSAAESAAPGAFAPRSLQSTFPGADTPSWPGDRDADDDLSFGSPPWGGEAIGTSEAAGERRGTRVRTVVREVVETGLLALLVFLAVRASFQNFRVEGQSMEPTLSDGEFLIVNKLVYSEVNMDRLSKFVPFVGAEPGEKKHVFHGPERGDVIVFRDPRNPEEDLIKRVIGLPGEKVEVRNGMVYINDMPLEEPYISTRWEGNKEARIIPASEYFVLGDNRGNSLDSRSEQIGLVHEDLIIGKAMLAYWPRDKFGSTLSQKPQCSPDPDCVSISRTPTGSAALPR